MSYSYRPDLIVQKFDIHKPSLTPGENFNLTFTIKNYPQFQLPFWQNDWVIYKENGIAYNSTVKLYLSKDSTIDIFDKEIGSYNIGKLVPHELSTRNEISRETKTVSATLPPVNDPIWNADNEKYTIGIIVDPDNDINEYSYIDEHRGIRGTDIIRHEWFGDDNNSTEKPVTIKVPSLIDLSFLSFYTDLEATSGDDISIDFQVNNKGNKSVQNIPINFYLSENNIISSSRDKYLGSYNLSNLNKNSSTKTLQKTLKLPNSNNDFWNSSGEYYIGAIVDANNSISETDERNNSIHKNVDIDLIQ
ncbi:MAG: hypothetical protein O4749_00170, partial [Trichodesmium sp. St5_bin2_1]|nr:hypothetical protein [Trichodesmium sp. St5_bin2_1]